MRKKTGTTFDKIFGKESKKLNSREISWMLEVSQASLMGLNNEQQVDYLYKKIDDGMNRYLDASKTPFDVALEFHFHPLMDKKIKFSSYAPIFSSSKDQTIIEENVTEFLRGLSDFVVKLKAAKSEIKPGSAMQIPRTLFPAAPQLDFKDGVIELVYEWKNYKAFGPFVLANLLKGCHVKNLRICPHCKRIFFTTHHRKAHCSKQCSDAEKAIKTDKDRIKDRLRSRKQYLAGDLKMKQNSNIAKHLEDDGFVEEMRDSGFFDDEEIKRLVPSKGLYGTGRSTKFQNKGK